MNLLIKKSGGLRKASCDLGKKIDTKGDGNKWSATQTDKLNLVLIIIKNNACMVSNTYLAYTLLFSY